jgi:hemolysin-activating ACP:hemolysin acyltransferase
MKLSFKLEFKRIKEFLNKSLRFLGEHLLSSFLLIFFLTLILGSFILYQYVFLVEKTEPNIFERPIFFNEDAYKEILEEWGNREKKIEAIDSGQYSNPFIAPISPNPTP